MPKPPKWRTKIMINPVNRGSTPPPTPSDQSDPAAKQKVYDLITDIRQAIEGTGPYQGESSLHDLIEGQLKTQGNPYPGSGYSVLINLRTLSIVKDLKEIQTLLPSLSSTDQSFVKQLTDAIPQILFKSEYPGGQMILNGLSIENLPSPETADELAGIAEQAATELSNF